jgi:hypothetical protein
MLKKMDSQIIDPPYSIMQINKALIATKNPRRQG